MIVFTAGMFLLLFLIAGITTLIDRSTEIRDIDMVVWYGVNKTSVKISSPNETALPYYDDIEVSLQEFYRKEPGISESNYSAAPQMIDEMVRFENYECLYAIFTGQLQNNVPCLKVFFFRKNDNKISYPIYMWHQDIISSRINPGIFYEEDRVARDIVQSYANDFTTRVNGGNILYYGAGLDAKLKNLTILGYTPTEVIPFEYNKQTYYFWYYLEDVPFTKILETMGVLKADIHDSPLGGQSGSFQFTTGDIIDCLEITFSGD